MTLRGSRLWQDSLAHATIYEGDVGECAKWLGYAKQKLQFMLHNTAGPLTATFNPAADVTVRVDTRPNRIYILTGGGFLSLKNVDSPIGDYPSGVPYQPFSTRDFVTQKGVVKTKVNYSGNRAYTGKKGILTWTNSVLFHNGLFVNLKDSYPAITKILCAGLLSDAVMATMVDKPPHALMATILTDDYKLRLFAIKGLVPATTRTLNIEYLYELNVTALWPSGFLAFYIYSAHVSLDGDRIGFVYRDTASSQKAFLFKIRFEVPSWPVSFINVLDKSTPFIRVTASVSESATLDGTFIYSGVPYQYGTRSQSISSPTATIVDAGGKLIGANFSADNFCVVYADLDSVSAVASTTESQSITKSGTVYSGSASRNSAQKIDANYKIKMAKFNLAAETLSPNTLFVSSFTLTPEETGYTSSSSSSVDTSNTVPNSFSASDTISFYATSSARLNLLGFCAKSETCAVTVDYHTQKDQDVVVFGSLSSSTASTVLSTTTTTRYQTDANEHFIIASSEVKPFYTDQLSERSSVTGTATLSQQIIPPGPFDTGSSSGTSSIYSGNPVPLDPFYLEYPQKDYLSLVSVVKIDSTTGSDTYLARLINYNTTATNPIVYTPPEDTEAIWGTRSISG